MTEDFFVNIKNEFVTKEAIKQKYFLTCFVGGKADPPFNTIISKTIRVTGALIPHNIPVLINYIQVDRLVFVVFFLLMDKV